MKRKRSVFLLLFLCFAATLASVPLAAQQSTPQITAKVQTDDASTQALASTQAMIDTLLRQLSAHEARIRELENKLEAKAVAEKATVPPAVGVTLASTSSTVEDSDAGALAKPAVVPAAMGSSLEAAAAVVPAAGSGAMNTASTTAPSSSMEAPDVHDHMINMPGGGPALKVRGFFDFNFGMGSIANPLIFPMSSAGCLTCGNPLTPAHSGFSAGEIDLFASSKLSEHLSFVGEVVLSAGTTNEFGVDVERYQLTYKANRYFSASAGRFHTSIGYYNTAYHHGNWFSTAEGRPIMYLFEDSGGVLPVHMVGLTFSGEVPHTEALGLHWTAELGNGLASNPAVSAPVQNYYTDRNYKATNLAFYVKPQFLSGLQAGGSWYHDGINPSQAQNPLNVAEVRQNIESAYLVYFSSNWEVMTEGVMESNHVSGTRSAFRSPMAYSQMAHKFGIYKPYVRYQYVRDNMNDPVNILRGTYYGPSVGVRVDMFEFAAFKVQFNHLYQSSQLAGNGLDAQMAFTF